MGKCMRYRGKYSIDCMVKFTFPENLRSNFIKKNLITYRIK